MKKNIVIASIVLSSTFTFGFDFNSIKKGVVDNLAKHDTNKASSTLSNPTLSKGLKEALKVGVDYAVKNLGAKGGYLNNAQVKIPLPENLQKAEGIVRKFGGNDMADDLINAMNNAATNAAPKTADIFFNAIEKMNLKDAKKIVSGDKNAATQYFKENTSASLKKMITPIIKKTMEENQVASYYKSFNKYYNQYGKNLVENSSVMKMAKSFGADSYLPSSSEESLDDYVTNKAINGLFKMIAQKEAQIRENPMEQTTTLLKQVFGK